MKKIAGIILICRMLASAAEPFDLLTVFSPPYLSGSVPDQVIWSPNDSLIAFLWNDQGGEFRNLWVSNPQTGQTERLTNFNPETNADTPAIGALGWLTNRSIFFEYRGDIWEASLMHQRTLKRIEGISEYEGPICLSPNGKYLTYGRRGNLMMFDLTAGQERMILPEVNFNKSSARQITAEQTDYRWSHRGDRIAAYMESESNESAVNFKVIDVQSGARDEIMIKDIPNRCSIVRDFIWSPDDQALVFESVTRNLLERYIVRIDLKKSRMDTLYREVRDTWVPDFGYRLIWLEPDAKILFGMEYNSYNHLYVIDPTNGRYTAVTRGKWSVRDYTVDAAGRAVYFTGTRDQPDQLQLYIARLKTGEIAPISYRGGDHYFYLSNNGRRIAEVFSNQSTPPELYWLDAVPQSKMNRITTRPNSPIGELQTKTVQTGVVQNELTGRAINYRMWLPDENLVAHKYPVIIILNGTDCIEPTTEAWRPEWYFQHSLSGKGYVIVAVEYTALRAAVSLTGQSPLSDPLAIQLSDIKSVVANIGKLDYVDLSRTGICGWGYGGYLAVMAMFKEAATFRSGAAILSDLSWSQPVGPYLAYLTNLLTANSRIYSNLDPQQYYHSLSGRLLVIQGAKEPLPRLIEADRLIPDLLAHHKKIDFYYYPWEGKTISRSLDQFDLLSKTVRFFRDNL